MLEDLVRNDSRYELAQKALIERIKNEENFKKMDVSNEDLLNTLSKGVFRSDWHVPQSYENWDLFQINDKIYSLEDFIQFLTKNIDVRYQRRLVQDTEAEMGNILDRYINHELLEYEKAHLEEKYPEFREIMREYREGIMLFEISKDKIWDRAGQDTAGLRAFYNQHQSHYHTPREIRYDEFIVNTMNPRVLEKIEKLIKKKNPEKVLRKLNKAAEVVKYKAESANEDVFLNQFEQEDQLHVGLICKNSDKTAGMTTFGKIKEIEPGKPLMFEEARGTVMSDYQKYLEDQWVAELQKKYDVELNDSVLHTIIRS
jgi:peptidyl-prolyl cis-trans isomerase SurA